MFFVFKYQYQSSSDLYIMCRSFVFLGGAFKLDLFLEQSYYFRDLVPYRSNL